MNKEYNLPSGLAGCEYYNELMGSSECRVPSKASDRNKALVEALQQLYLMQNRFATLSEQLQATSYDAQVEALGHCREVLNRLAKRGAIVVDGVVYAPVAKRVRK